MSHEASYLRAYASVPHTERTEQVLVVDVTGRRHTIRVGSANLFRRMIREGGPDAGCWYETAEGGAVRHGALACILP